MCSHVEQSETSQLDIMEILRLNPQDEMVVKREMKMKIKKGKSKKSAPKNYSPNYLKDFLFALSKFSGYLMIVIIAISFVTGYAMVESNQFLDYIHLDKELAFYLHKQLIIPFCVCIILHILPRLSK